jgi:hypothetical protein
MSSRVPIGRLSVFIRQDAPIGPSPGGHDTREGASPMAAKPNIVLVHGAWADGSCWSAIIAQLQADGG